ncbi:CRTAC1 family protein [Dermatobacter hominis]|uniref:CRTAC1 family protein n=1 Tax=Dermatobacter hominis TaxID=2884263 RepID=UPI001D0FA7E5|nr:CRTAC1 family protein [Dermatobacter hominis]UDY37396.1 CRTAC1 family protein [Dermatobacter hominis]
MAMAQRRVIPLVALVAVVALLVVLRLVLGGDDDGAAAGAGTAATAPDRPAAAGDLRFTDVTAEAGLDEPHSGPAPAGGAALTGESAMTAGAAVHDVDDDGDLDVFLTRIGRPDRLMLNDGDGRFTDGTRAAGLDRHPDGQGSSAAAFADVDGDGDDDLLVTASGGGGTTLHRNDGDGRFADATAGSGLDDLPPVGAGELAQAHGITPADFDQDGDLDVLVTHWDDTIVAALADPSAADIRPAADGTTVCPRAAWLAERRFPRADGAPANRGRLYRNDGDGRFRDVSAEVGLPFDEIMGFTGTFADVDGDGWDDLLITGDFCTSRLFRNEGGTRFSDVTAAAGVGTDENGMGSVVADLDGDGLPDWFVTGIGPVGDDPAPLPLGGGFGSSGNRAYLNVGGGRFRDATDELGLRNGGWGWGAAVEDFGNDGRRSVVMTNGYSTGDDDREAAASDPLVFWARDGASHTDVAAAIGLDDRGLGRALVPFDADRDGDLDLLVADFGGPPRLYRNDSPPRRWLTVRLDDPSTPGNRAGIGAEVVVTPDGGDPVTSWLLGGGSYESQVPAEVHVGLDRAERARVEVRWPGTTAPQVVDEVPADQVLVVRRDA